MLEDVSHRVEVVINQGVGRKALLAAVPKGIVAINLAGVVVSLMEVVVVNPKIKVINLALGIVHLVAMIAQQAVAIMK
jgi:hypothetical protein